MADRGYQGHRRGRGGKPRMRSHCELHDEDRAEFICGECGGSFCWSCLRTRGHPYVCPECIDSYTKKVKKQSLMIGVFTIIAVVLLIASPFLVAWAADAMDEPDDDDDVAKESYVTVQRDDMYLGLEEDTYNLSGDGKIGVLVKVLVHNSGDLDSDDVDVQAHILRGDILLDEANRSVGIIAMETTEEVRLPVMRIRPDEVEHYTIEIVVWEGHQVIQKSVMTIKVTMDDVQQVDYQDPTDGTGGGGDGGDSDTSPSIADDKEEGSGAVKGGGLSGGGLVFVLIVVAALIIAIIGIVQYSRLRGRIILKNPNRAQLYDEISKNPGQHYRGLAKEMDMGQGTMTHHMQTLEREGYIKAKTDGQYKRFYPTSGGPGYVPPDDGAPGGPGGPDGPGGPGGPGGGPAPSTRVPEGTTRDRIMEHIKGNSGCTQQEIADALGLPKQTVNYNVDQLRKTGKITTERDGRTSRCYPAVW